MIDQMQRSALGVLKILENKGLVTRGAPEGLARTWVIS